MKLASAQTKPKRGDIQQNLADHYRLTEIAAGQGAGLIVFPEMSITGYEREQASGLAFTTTDSRLDHLRKLSDKKKIIIIAGAPIIIKDSLYIGSFVIQPGLPLAIYTKQFLHSGEEVYFQSSFDYNPLIEIAGERISLAICADIDHPEHAENASKARSTIYMPGIFFSPKGIPEAYHSLRNYAKKHSMQVLMSNFSGEAWGQPAAGRSGFWDSKGNLIVAMDSDSTGLLLVEKKQDDWTGQVIKD